MNCWDLTSMPHKDNLYHLVQCPNPDFNNPEHRWRMLQRSLIKAVVDLLALDGKVTRSFCSFRFWCCVIRSSLLDFYHKAWNAACSSLLTLFLNFLRQVFLQSDIEAVALRMKELFLKIGKGKLNLWNDQYHARMNLGEWLEENPFGVMSDWEQHVIDRGAPMYRLMLSKSSGIEWYQSSWWVKARYIIPGCCWDTIILLEDHLLIISMWGQTKVFHFIGHDISYWSRTSYVRI